MRNKNLTQISSAKQKFDTNTRCEHNKYAVRTQQQQNLQARDMSSHSFIRASYSRLITSTQTQQS